jgi:FkbM family methyltransferase
VGQFARYARKYFPRSQIHCFEPLPSVAEELKRWAESADKNLAVHETALGERAGVSVMIEHLDHSPSSSFLQNTPRADRMFPQTVRHLERQVQVDTLDAWVDRHQVVIDTNSLLKLDVQGFESQVLRGGREVLQRLGICMVEVTPIPLYEGQSTFVEITNLLATGGLHYLGNMEQFHDANGLPVYMDAVFMRPTVFGSRRA